MVWLVVIYKDILNRRNNSIDKYLENTNIVVVNNGSIFSSLTFFAFVKKIDFPFLLLVIFTCYVV